jgi:uncharacterized protein involved in exopolysaccharide biosynthesis
MESAKNQPPAQGATQHFHDYWRVIRICKTVITPAFLLAAITATVVTITPPESHASASPILSQDQLEDDRARLIEEQTDYVKLETQLTRLQTIQATNAAELRDVLPTVRSDPMLAKLSNRLRETDQELAALMVNETASYPQVMMEQQLTNELNTEISQRIRGIMAGMTAQAAALQASRDNISNVVQESFSSASPTPSQKQMNQKQLEDYRSQMVKEQKDYMKLQTRLISLQTIQATNAAELRVALTNTIPDTTLVELLDRLHETDKDLAARMVNETTNDPDVMKDQQLTNELTIQVNARIEGIMAGLGTEVAALQASCDTISKTVQEDIQMNQPKNANP